MCAADAGRGCWPRQPKTRFLQHLACFCKEQQGFLTLLRVHVTSDYDGFFYGYDCYFVFMTVFIHTIGYMVNVLALLPTVLPN